MAIASLGLSAQNIQFHYDFGKHIYSDEEESRQNVTITYETFSADKLGSWYWFIDADLNKNGVQGAYTEISREFNFAKATDNSSFAAHVELDAGMNKVCTFQTAALFGAAWNGHNADYSTTYSVQAMYKQFFGQKFNGGCQAALYDAYCKPYASFQLTGVWSTRFAHDKLTFAGFIDFWRGQKSNGHGQLVILTEPQLWYQLGDLFGCPNLNVGGEVEISNNFGTYDGWKCNPCLGLKWDF